MFSSVFKPYDLSVRMSEKHFSTSGHIHGFILKPLKIQTMLRIDLRMELNANVEISEQMVGLLVTRSFSKVSQTFACFYSILFLLQRRRRRK